MSSREHVLELARKLEKARSKCNVSKVQQILESLESAEFDMTIALLTESGLGKKVNAIGKTETFKSAANLQQTAKRLVAKWKEVVSREKKKRKKKTNGAGAGSKKRLRLKLKLNKTPTPTPPASEGTGERERSESVAQSEDSPPLFVRAEYDWQTGDKRRDKMISKFISVLQPARDCAEYGCFRELAADIEAALGKAYGSDSEAYIAKYRDLHYNLKKNTELVESLLRGHTAAHSLVQMSSEELADRTLKAKRDKDKKFAMEDARSDLKGTKVAMTDEYKCGRCKQRKCKYSQAQTRGADEPMTTFVSCLVCGNRWKC